MNDKRSEFSVMNDIVNDEKGHNIVNDSFVHKPDGLLLTMSIKDSRAVALPLSSIQVRGVMITS